MSSLLDDHAGEPARPGDKVARPPERSALIVKTGASAPMLESDRNVSKRTKTAPQKRQRPAKAGRWL